MRAGWAARGCACSVRPGTAERAFAVVSETAEKSPTPEKVARFVAKTLWKNRQIERESPEEGNAVSPSVPPEQDVIVTIWRRAETLAIVELAGTKPCKCILLNWR